MLLNPHHQRVISPGQILARKPHSWSLKLEVVQSSCEHAYIGKISIQVFQQEKIWQLKVTMCQDIFVVGCYPQRMRFDSLFLTIIDLPSSN